MLKYNSSPFLVYRTHKSSITTTALQNRERTRTSIKNKRLFRFVLLDLFDVNKCEKIFETHLGIMNSEQQIKKEWE